MTPVNKKWLLALETSVTEATLLLACGGEVMATRSFRSERSQECHLFPPLRDLLAELPEGARLSTILVGTGPGSYNGARVGIAVAQAVAQTHGCRVAGMSSFEGVPETQEEETVWAVGDARRGSYFLMPIIAQRVQSPPLLLSEEEFRAKLTTCAGSKVTFESPDRLPEGTECRESPATAAGLLSAWLRRTPEEQETLLGTAPEAFYLRPPHITKSKK